MWVPTGRNGAGLRAITQGGGQQFTYIKPGTYHLLYIVIFIQVIEINLKYSILSLFIFPFKAFLSVSNTSI